MTVSGDISSDEELSAELYRALASNNIDKLEFLINGCGVSIEQRIVYKCEEDGSFHLVTPLWYAAVTGKLDLLKWLVKKKASIHSLSDKGSTPVRSACFMNHYEIVKYLIGLGADIGKPNYSGGTCLINAIQATQLCQLLLENGAQVNAQDNQGKTALHYAISERRTKTVLLLISNGADVNIKNNSGEDALMMACIHKAEDIFEFLLMTFEYSDEHVANAYELIGAVFFDEQLDLAKASKYWKTALIIRNRDPHNPIRKAKVEPKAVYRYLTEFETEEELNRLLVDVDSVKIQSLLIYERILGVYHHHTVFRLLFRGASYADSLQFDRSISIWRYALELKIQRLTLLGSDTSFTLAQFVALLFDFYTQSSSERQKVNLFPELMTTTRSLINELKPSMQSLTIRPVFQEHLVRFDSCLKSLTHLLYVLVLMPTDKQERQELYELTRKIVQMDPRDSNNNSLLHLAVSRKNEIESYSAPRIVVFPDVSVVNLLLKCGADVDAVNNELCTPLHISSLEDNYYPRKVSGLLLHYGAHIDRRDSKGSRPISQIKAVDPCFNIMDHISLKCLAAQAVVMHNVRYKGLVPEGLERFLQIH